MAKIDCNQWVLVHSKDGSIVRKGDIVYCNNGHACEIVGGEFQSGGHGRVFVPNGHRLPSLLGLEFVKASQLFRGDYPELSDQVVVYRRIEFGFGCGNIHGDYLIPPWELHSRNGGYVVDDFGNFLNCRTAWTKDFYHLIH